MNIKLLITILILLPTLAKATPPNNLLLNYDVELQKLDITANHPSERLERHFIRRVVVTKNSKDTQEFYFVRQVTPGQFKATLDYKTEPGDHLDVKLSCMQGGSAEVSLDIPKSEDIKTQIVPSKSKVL